MKAQANVWALRLSSHYYSGLAQVMPLFATYFLIFTMANIALPGTSSFVGEFLILLGIFKVNFVTASAVILSVVLCGSYSLWVFNKVSFGQLKYLYTNFANDLAKRELLIIFPLFFCVIILGFYPYLCLKYIHASAVVIQLKFFI